MEYRKLGETNIQITPISFGAWAIGGWMWGGANQADAIGAIRTSFDEGVTTIDTAPVYGQGKSEELVGEAIKTLPRSKVQLLTKFGMRWDIKKGDFSFESRDNNNKTISIYKYSGKKSIIDECEKSLQRLGTDYIDLYQQHWPDSTTPVDETMDALCDLLKQGKILAAGVCNYNKNQMKEAEKTLSLVSNQVPYSMVYRGIEAELVPFCIENKKSIIAYSPLQRGLLTGKIKPGHIFSEGDSRASSRFYKKENLAIVNDFLKKLEPVAASKNVTVSQLVIRWTIDRPGITAALVGARNAVQAKENAGAFNVNISDEEKNLINAAIDELRLAD